jgi:hypothetical protein
MCCGITKAIALLIFELCSAPSRLVATLRPRGKNGVRPSGLDGACAQLAKSNCAVAKVGRKSSGSFGCKERAR